MQIREVFDRKRFVFLDGGMGTQLQARGLQPGQKPELAALEMPEVLTAIHTDYANAGADILLANTFGANAKKLTGCGHTVEEVVSASIACARKAAETTGACVALDIGPLGELLVPAGTLAFEDAYNEFAQVIRAGAAAGANLVFLETMTDLYELKAAIRLALANDRKVVFEAFVDGHEVECAVIGSDPAVSTRPGEILAGAEFYTYDDKYKNGVSQTVIPAHLSEEKLDEVRAEARKAYLALGCSGLSRCDFFVERGTGRVLCNELNTLPGFTSISMYPKLMEHEGYSYPALLDKLLTLAVHRRKGAY